MRQHTPFGAAPFAVCCAGTCSRIQSATVGATWTGSSRADHFAWGAPSKPLLNESLCRAVAYNTITGFLRRAQNDRGSKMWAAFWKTWRGYPREQAILANAELQAIHLTPPLATWPSRSPKLRSWRTQHRNGRVPGKAGMRHTPKVHGETIAQNPQKTTERSNCEALTLPSGEHGVFFRRAKLQQESPRGYRAVPAYDATAWCRCFFSSTTLPATYPQTSSRPK